MRVALAAMPRAIARARRQPPMQQRLTLMRRGKGGEDRERSKLHDDSRQMNVHAKSYVHLRRQASGKATNKKYGTGVSFSTENILGRRRSVAVSKGTLYPKRQLLSFAKLDLNTSVLLRRSMKNCTISVIHLSNNHDQREGHIQLSSLAALYYPTLLNEESYFLTYVLDLTVNYL